MAVQAPRSIILLTVYKGWVVPHLVDSVSQFINSGYLRFKIFPPPPLLKGIVTITRQHERLIKKTVGDNAFGGKKIYKMEYLFSLFNQETGNDYGNWFKKIATELCNNYIIKTPNVKYRLKEIEFYYYGIDHQDETTYGFMRVESKVTDPGIKRHKKVQTNQGTWFFHYSGVDIVFGKDNNPGGILIRAIQQQNTGEMFKGPLIVLLELLNQAAGIDGSKSISLQLV